MELLGPFVVIAYTTIAAFQWCAANEANRINKEALVSVQRAFVYFDGVQYSRHVAEKDPGKIQTVDGYFLWPQFNNAGATEALDGSYWVNRYFEFVKESDPFCDVNATGQIVDS